MEVSTILTILGSGAVTAIVGAVVNGVINRRKLGADVTKTSVEAIGGVVQRLEDENERLTNQQSEQRKEIDELLAWKRGAQAREDEHRQMLMVHAAADHLLIERLRVTFPHETFTEMPPLYPPVASPSPKDA